MIKEVMNYITQADPEVGKLIATEYDRQQNNIELIASENILSDTSMLAMGTILTNKYAEGYPGKRYYGGCVHVDDIETIAIERAKKLFNCEYANVQPHSGAQANMAVTMAICKPGDKILGMSLDAGGHLTHGSPANFSGSFFNIIPNVFGVEKLKDAMEHPEKPEYANFTIRVSGYAVKFIDLTREQQLDVISRTCHERLA